MPTGVLIFYSQFFWLAKKMCSPGKVKRKTVIRRSSTMSIKISKSAESGSSSEAESMMRGGKERLPKVSFNSSSLEVTLRLAEWAPDV